MAATEVVPGLYMLALGPVNAFLLVASGDCTVIEAGLPRSAAKLTIQRTNVRRVLLTHAHPDHIGGFAALKSITGAAAYMYPADATIAISGKGFRPMMAAPGLLRGLMFRLFVRPVASVEGAPVEHSLKDGEELPIAGGLKGHSICLATALAKLAFLWRQHGGVACFGHGKPILKDAALRLRRLWS